EFDMQLTTKLIATFAVICGSNLASATPFEDYNMILFSDFAASGGSGHVHGASFIGGNLYGQTPEFGADLPKSSTQDTLEVAGDLNANHLTVQAGYLSYGGDNNLGSINCNGNGLSGSGCVRTASGLDAKADALRVELNASASYYAGLSANGSIDLTGRALSYSGSATDLAIFNLDGSDLFAQNSNWNLDFGLAESVVINVSGVDLASLGGINLNGGFNHTNAANILWNFYDAESVNFGSTQWFGSILATGASIDTANDLNGTLVADSYVGNGQIHIASWSGTPTTSVPEPNINLLLMAGLGFIGASRLRRTRRS
ncbi:MAG: choice-of-anchor A family protein, partial [Candidatus Thiodiazotropha sp.]